MLIPYLMKVSLTLAVLTVAYRCLIQFETFSKLNRALLWFNVVIAWLLPLTPLPDWGPVEVQRQFHDQLPAIKSNLTEAAPAALVPAAAQAIPLISNITNEPALTPGRWLLIAYLAGMLVIAALFIGQLFALVRMIVRSGRQRTEDGLILVIHAGIRSPFSFLKWVVCDPGQHSPEEFRHILAHESEHIKQWHGLDLIASELQRIALWFNPFAWHHRKLVQANLEYLADKGVLDAGFEKKSYQYDLLNAVMRTREMPLTNSFAQSLLKKRIKMINKKPSHYLALGKYAALLAMIYVCSAFVAPYREQIVVMAPEAIRPLVGEVILPARTFEQPQEAALSEPDGAKPRPNEAIPAIAKSARETADSVSELKPQKGILIVNGTLYWAITPLSTWEDITQIKNAIHKFGQEFQINKIEFDPLQKYITAISVRIDTKSGYGAGGEEGNHEFQPMKGYSGYIADAGHGMGQLPPDPLGKEMKQDYEKALAIAKENEVAYFEYKLTRSFGSHSGHSFSRELLTGPKADRFYEKDGIGKSPEDKLRISEYHKNATFYLNTNTSTFTELNDIPISKVKKVSLLEDNARRKYIIVYAL